MRALFEKVFCTPTDHMLTMLYNELKDMGIELAADGKMYTYYPGTIPIMLVAHVDTVHRETPSEVILDEKHWIAWSPTGLGADDRAGVWAILSILHAGWRPHVLFTDGEETGGKGAKEALKAFTPRGVHCLIEMDRRNSNDSVFYSNDNQKFKKWVNHFGFTEAFGSYTDISDLMPAWKLAGVNLSIGYYDAHSKQEHLRLLEAHATIKKVCKMLATPPKKVVPYVEKVWHRQSVGEWSQSERGGWFQRVSPSTIHERHLPANDYDLRRLPEKYQEKKS